MKKCDLNREVDSDKHISFEIRTLSHSVKRFLDSAQDDESSHKPLGMHGWIIGFLYENSDKDIYQRDLEEMLNIRRSSVSAALSQMESKGLIKRESVEHDARLKKIVLTDMAKAMHENFRQNLCKLESTMKSGISDEEVEIFIAIAEKIKKNLDQEEK